VIGFVLYDNVVAGLSATRRSKIDPTGT